MSLLLATSVLDFHGPKFLLLFALLLAISVVVSCLIIQLGRRMADAPCEIEPDDVGSYEAAFLAGGMLRLAEAAVAALCQGGYVQVSLGTTLKTVMALPDHAPQVERDVYASAGARGQLRDMRDAVRGAGNVIRYRLIEQRLLLPFSRRLAIKLSAAAVFVPVLVLGVLKINIGLNRDKPVLFLGLLCVLTVMLMFAMAWNVRRSWAGSAMLRTLRRGRARHDTGGLGEDVDLVMWECALFGAAAVATGELTSMGLFLSPRPNSSSSHSDSGCSDGGGCSGCGGCGGD